MIALLLSDIHLRHKPPLIWDGSEWYEVMRRYLLQVTNLMTDWSVPIIVAGDIFNTWREPAELINFALQHFPECYAVPGQHDLPYHNYEDMHKSPFYTLVKVGKIKLIDPDQPTLFHTLSTSPKKLALYGFPYGRKVIPLSEQSVVPEGKDWIHLAVIHKYIWMKGHKFDGAPKKLRMREYAHRLDGYTAAVFGDNHSGFLGRIGRMPVLNCGGFIRSKVDELDYKPTVGLLHASGVITREHLDTRADEFIDTKKLSAETGKKGKDLDELIEEIHSLAEAGICFKEVVEKFLKSSTVSDGVKEILLRAIDNGKQK